MAIDIALVEQPVVVTKAGESAEQPVLRKASRSSLRAAVRAAVRSCRPRAVAQPGAVAPDAVGQAAAGAAGAARAVRVSDPDGDAAVARAESEFRGARLAGALGDGRVKFDRKACPKLAEGEDPVDAVRALYPDADRFVLCGPGDVEIARYKLLEDANEAARKQTVRTVVYAIKSGKAMSFTSPGGGTVKQRAARLNRDE